MQAAKLLGSKEHNTSTLLYAILSQLYLGIVYAHILYVTGDKLSLRLQTMLGSMWAGFGILGAHDEACSLNSNSDPQSRIGSACRTDLQPLHTWHVNFDNWIGKSDNAEAVFVHVLFVLLARRLYDNCIWYARYLFANSVFFNCNFACTYICCYRISALLSGVAPVPCTDRHGSWNNALHVDIQVIE